MLLLHSIRVKAHDIKLKPSEAVKEVYVTCYTATGNPCANGKYPEEGIVAYCPHLIDEYVMLMWESREGIPGEFIGLYKIWDTGNANIKKGYVVDVYRDSLERCKIFAEAYGAKVFIEVLTEQELEQKIFNTVAEHITAKLKGVFI